MPGVDGRENRWAEPSPSDFDRWRDLVADGQEPGDAARQLGFSGSSAFGRADLAQHREVLDLAQEMRRTTAGRKGLAKLHDLADNPDTPHAVQATVATTLVRIGGLLTDRSEVQLTGANGGPVELAVQEARDKLAARLTGIADRRATETGASSADG